MKLQTVRIKKLKRAKLGKLVLARYVGKRQPSLAPQSPQPWSVKKRPLKYNIFSKYCKQILLNPLFIMLQSISGNHEVNANH